MSWERERRTLWVLEPVGARDLEGEVERTLKDATVGERVESIWRER